MPYDSRNIQKIAQAIHYNVHYTILVAVVNKQIEKRVMNLVLSEMFCWLTLIVLVNLLQCSFQRDM